MNVWQGIGKVLRRNSRGINTIVFEVSRSSQVGSEVFCLVKNGPILEISDSILENWSVFF